MTAVVLVGGCSGGGGGGVAVECRVITYKYGYYLVDGTYPEYAVFVKSFTCLNDTYWKKIQERAEKDVMRAFEALKKCWFILKKPAIFLSGQKMHEVMYACIILHNMIIENEGRGICEYDEEETIPATQAIEIRGDEYIEKRAEIRCNETYHNLRMDLVEQIYEFQHINLSLDPKDDPKDDSDDDFI
ncbi:uncharacterized protein LOC111889602 [Lactuca sativa]|uniref:uncharacterized protein LOC111889602 n=1 Tax=Lactuca sativa TaxID=4236 RepID=UPI000CD8D9F7|nr:uncharacterized protein LOC111889602 [Lactuca sativa]